MAAVLLIDDDPHICEVIEDYLQTCDMTVQCAYTGEGAAKMLAQYHYDLAIIDVALPGISGLDLAAIAANGNTSVLLMSGYLDSNFKLRQFDYPYLAKPFTLDALRIAAVRVISEHAENLARVKASAARMLANTAALKAGLAASDRLLNAARTQQQLGRWGAVSAGAKSHSSAPG